MTSLFSQGAVNLASEMVFVDRRTISGQSEVTASSVFSSGSVASPSQNLSAKWRPEFWQ